MSAATPSFDTIFCAAIEIAAEADRAAYVAQACGDDADLRARVEKLVAAHFRAGSFLEAPAPNLGPTGAVLPPAPPVPVAAADAEGVGTVIGPYKLLQAIGEGAMGSVFMAEQTQPVQRKVALKLIKPGMDSHQVIARFEAERQALALMDHPNIAKVLDAGATATGRPYFVMELVKGLPLTRYCDERRLTPRQRLELFIPVCQAVQHAHQKGIIHRDLKPSNVLVASYDGTPVPKVIDFGIAKAIDQKLTDRTLFTGFGTVVGTLEYMSPEQAEPNQLDVDTRSDVYSLGVLLYELLTGTTPLDKKRLKEVALLEVLRLIREEEPPKPSTRLSATDELPAVAANRGLESKKLSGLVRGELDWIAMKCLEKDRNRRYETANGLAMDLQRYLYDEPVLAGPPSRAYRLKKFLRRHRGPVLAVALVLLALVGGIVGTTVGLVRAERAKEEAQKRLVQIEKGTDILGSIFRELNPRTEEKEGKTLRVLLGKRLEQAVKQLDGEAIGDPLIVAKLQTILGWSLTNLGQPSQAAALLEKAVATRAAQLGDDHLETVSSRNHLAVAYLHAGKLVLAIPLHERTLKAAEAQLGGEHPQTLEYRNDLAVAYLAAGKLKLATPLLERTLKAFEAQLGDDHPETLNTRNNLAQAYQAAGKLDLAIPLFERTLKTSEAQLGDDHPDTLRCRNNLALAYQEAGKLELAISLFERTLKACEAKLGDNHPHTFLSRNNLARAYQAAGELKLAIPLFERTLKAQEVQLGDDHPDTLITCNNLAGAYRAAGKLDLVVPLCERTLQAREAKLGTDHPSTLITRNNLARAYQDAGKLELAIPLFERTLKTCEATLGDDHPQTHFSRNYLAMAYKAAGKLELATPLLERTLQARVTQLGDDHPDTFTTRNNLALAYLAARKLDLAIPLFERALKDAEAKLGEDNPLTLEFRNDMALAYQAAGKLDLAIPLLERTLKTSEAKLGDDHPETLRSRNNLALAYQAAGKLELAIPLFATVVPQAIGKLGAAHPNTIRVTQNWIDALEANRQFARAADARQKLLVVERKLLPAEDPRLAGALVQLGQTLLKADRPAEAELVLRESLAIREKKDPDGWSTFNTRSKLGAALLGQKKYTEAEPLLLQGYHGMKQRSAKIPPQGKARLVEALEYLVQMYEAIGKKDEAAKWGKELEAVKTSNPTPPPTMK